MLRGEVAVKKSARNRSDKLLLLLRAQASRHPRIARVMAFGVDRRTRTAVMVMQLAEHGSLRAAIDAKRFECNSLLLRVLCEAAEGLAFLHSLGILRRDTACRYLLLDANDHALVADLGYARKLAADKDYYKSKGAERPYKWMAPEEFADEEARCTRKSDVYMFGMTMWEALTRGAAFYEGRGDYDEVKRLVLGGTRPARAPLEERGCVVEAATLIYDCLAGEPERRPDMAQVATRLDAIVASELTRAGRRDEAAERVRERQATERVAGDAATKQDIMLLLEKIEIVRREREE
jgi:serine/threonine protein kinase